MSRRTRVAAGLLLAVAVIVFLLLRSAGNALIVDEPPQKAKAIVVLAGGIPFRAMEGATLYKEGYAPEVWLTRGDEENPEEQALNRIGIHQPAEYELSAQVLERFGVPRNAITVLAPSTPNTAAEVRAIAAALQPDERAIIVSSKSHTRRIRVIWWKLVGSERNAIIRYARADQADIAHWWRSTRTVLPVAREWFGILNALLGFPVATRP